MKLDDINVMIDKIKEADYVLIGLGEEWNITLEDVLEDSRTKSIYEKIDRASDLEYGSDFVLKLYNQNCECERLKKAYNNLLEIISEKNYFIVSTTIDSNLTKYGFDQDKIVHPCGNVEYLQCKNGCTKDLIKIDDLNVEIQKYLDSNENDMVKNHLKCPNCKEELVFNNIYANKYIEEGYLPNWSKYMNWLQKTINRKLVVLELGVGLQYPSVIRWPFEKTVMYNQKSFMFRVHHSLAMVSSEISDRSYATMTDSVKLISTCKSDGVSL